MNKSEISIGQLKYHILAPGNIFWKKISGEEILISKKGDLINFSILEKISNKSQTLLINDGIDTQVMEDGRYLFVKYLNSNLIKEKNYWRIELFKFLNIHFIQKDRIQLELDLLLWSLFSNISFEDGKKYFEQDSAYFKRSLVVAGHISLVTLSLGYYDMNFLKDLYSEIIIVFNKVIENESIVSMKEILEEFRTNSKKKLIEKLNLKKIIEEKFSITLFESIAGSGRKDFLSFEMCDFEIVAMEVNGQYSYNFEYQENNFLKQLFAVGNEKLIFGEKDLKALLSVA